MLLHTQEYARYCLPIQMEKSFFCSGAIINNRVIATAGHCVHSGNGDESGWYQNFVVIPDYRSGIAPYSSWVATNVLTTYSWYYGGGFAGNDADFGLIVVADINGIRIGKRLGYFGYKTNNLVNNHVTMLGYPANLDAGEKMHQVNSAYKRLKSPNCVEYPSDMGGGSSGGPWVQDFGEPALGQSIIGYPNIIVGITSYGPVSTSLRYQGSSILNANFTNLLQLACADAIGNCN
eukprot:TRINITY_DN222_c0_g1_i2.p1 TRINITY_DN222_c0_g1~~TRINITY_DN222_c0_g1_i2.p1  ORF type:complete len:234 (-),score=39.41 TRINITY_DN222_c0_g1_i2:94-795(-)